MNDWKSKMPSLKEVATMSTKLVRDIKNSVCDIVAEYKKNHPDITSTRSSDTCSSQKEDAKSTTQDNKKEK